jgi:hypothetical protein
MNYREANRITKDLLKNPGSKNKYTKSEINQAIDIVDARLQRIEEGQKRTRGRLEYCRDEKAVDASIKELLAEYGL